MKTIYKTQLSTSMCQYVKLPIGSRILKVDVQNDDPVMWYSFDKDKYGGSYKSHRITAVMTGCDVPEETENYIGTVQLGRFVFHYFEV